MSTATATTLVDGSKRRVIHVKILGDAGGDVSNAVIYDHSADTIAGDAGKYSIEKIWHGSNSFDTMISFDGATNFDAFYLSQNTTEEICFSEFGGIPDKSTTPTGDILLSTQNLATGEQGVVIISLRKT